MKVSSDFIDRITRVKIASRSAQDPRFRRNRSPHHGKRSPAEMWSVGPVLAFWILVLAVSEPLLTHADKVVVVVPQQIRRSPAPPWRSMPPRFRKSSHESHFRRHHGPPGYYHQKRPSYNSLPFPHGGDDFDQGHETVNHVRIPYGKDVSHAITFGKGYIPYDQLKGSFSVGSEKYPEPEESKSEPGYEPTSFSPSGSEYQLGQSFETSEPFFSDPDSAMSYNERRNDRKKFYSSRSIGKDLTVNNPIDLSAMIDQGKEQLLFLQQKTAELYKNVQPQPQGEIVLPHGIPPATIGGSKDGIVLRDSLSLDNYQQKLQEMTKSWPQYLVNGASGLTSGLTAGYQSQQLIPSYQPAQQSPSPFTASFNWPLNIAQPKKGYAVKEDTMEPPHDFRTMPIQTNPFQSYPVQVNAAVSPLVQTVNG
ncbi:uncharacterized protein LOC143356984 [Halictus rubicundus]|uniref:uncharacterized protein LOC143356984 n=1 Tax=Halictus rubicundus TaxID=77578 RepID=UPI004036F147